MLGHRASGEWPRAPPPPTSPATLASPMPEMNGNMGMGGLRHLVDVVLGEDEIPGAPGGKLLMRRGPENVSRM